MHFISGLQNNAISKNERKITTMLLVSSFGYVSLALPFIIYYTFTGSEVFATATDTRLSPKNIVKV